MAFVIKTNPGVVSPYLIRSLGIVIPQAGGSEVLSDRKDIEDARSSEQLRSALVDDAFGVGSSTLIMSDGSLDIAQSHVLNFIDSYLNPPGVESFGVVSTDASGEIVEDLVTNATSPGSLTNWKLGSDLEANAMKITGLADGVQPGDAVNKSQLDAVSGGTGGAGGRGKLQFGATRAVPASGTLHLRWSGRVIGSTGVGPRMIRGGEITGLSLQSNKVDALRAFRLVVQKSTDGGVTWSDFARVELAISQRGVSTTAPTPYGSDLLYSSGDVMRTSIVRTSGTGRSTPKHFAAMVEVVDA